MLLEYIYNLEYLILCLKLYNCIFPSSDAHERLCLDAEPYKVENLCQDFENICPNGECIVTPDGGFVCECDEGFRNNSKGDCVGKSK